MEASDGTGIRWENKIHVRADARLARKPIVIRGGSGLGDSIYVQSVARHLVEQGNRVEVCTNFPEVYSQLEGASCSSFRRQDVDRIAHYVSRKKKAGTDIFQDCCLNAGIREEVDLRLDWRPVGSRMVDMVRTGRRPAIAVLLPREPMARKDGFGRELLPVPAAMQQALYYLRRGGARTIQVGSGTPLFELRGIDTDLANKTTVTELLDLAAAVDGFFGYCSFFVPLAESLKKPALFLWARAGLRSQRDFIATVTPKKILHRQSSRFVMDDAGDMELRGACNAFLGQARAAPVL